MAMDLNKQWMVESHASPNDNHAPFLFPTIMALQIHVVFSKISHDPGQIIIQLLSTVHVNNINHYFTWVSQHVSTSAALC